jgi:arsenate reductase (glutaredoxin)
MALQIFGTRKCPDTRKAGRFFKEHGMRFQFIDLSEKGISPGELQAVARAVGKDALMDVDAARYAARGLAHIDHDPEEEILKDPLLLRTPVVRDGNRAVIGPDPVAWKGFLGSSPRR